MRTDSAPPPAANPPVRRGPTPEGPGEFLLASIKMAWRWLIRMRTALYILAILALQTLLATIVPQEPNVPVRVAEWRSGTAGPGAFWADVIDLVGGFDVYGSPAFLALLLLLFLSLTACLIPRYRAVWRVWRRSRPPRTRNLGAQDHVTTFEVDVDDRAAEAATRSLLADRRWRLRDPDVDEGLPPQVAAEKGHVLREAGSLLFHTSFYVLLVGIVAGQLLGFSGQVGIIEGQPGFSDTAAGYWSYDAGRLWGPQDHRGFTLRLDRFKVAWHRDPALGGQPRIFESDVTVTTADGRTFQETVGGNDPLVVEGMKIHQLDWGYAPSFTVRVDGEAVHEGPIIMNRTGEGFWRGVVKVPNLDPGLGLRLFLWPTAPEDPDTGEAVFTGAPWADAPFVVLAEYRGDLQLDRVQNVFELDTTRLELRNGARLRPGDEVTLPDGVEVRFDGLDRWTGFQVSRRPTVPLLLVGGLLVLAGLIPSLYAYRRRLWVRAVTDPDSGRTLVTVAGRAFQRESAFEDEFATLADDLREHLQGAEPTEKRPTDGPRDAEPDAVLARDAAHVHGGDGSVPVRGGVRPDRPGR